MGIPRLTQDLQPYLEDVVICTNKATSSTIRVGRVIIDGPGMVYHVYNKLAALRLERAVRKDIYSPPTYRQLCAAVQFFLADLGDCGAEIVHIYFDGGLPEDKRPTRLARLERTLQQLADFRSAKPTLSLEPASNDNDALLVQQAIWSTSTPSNSNIGLPQLPFIVAAAREYLKHSQWSQCTSTVPGEADFYCAAATRSSQSAVLTNDSDLLLYRDLQEDGIIILLNDLSREVTHQKDQHCIRGSCWRPSEIRTQLNIASLLRLGYERMQDPNCSFMTVKQRAMQISTDVDTDEFRGFARQFQSQKITHKTKTASSHVPSSPLGNLDPRLSELVFQLSQNHDTHDTCTYNMYFPILHEDPTRDSSWSYGRTYRQSGYSILYHYLKSQQPKKHVRWDSNASVVEFTRKAQTISESFYPILSGQELSTNLGQYSYDLCSLRILSNEGNGRNLGFAVSKYILYALSIVLLQRDRSGRPRPSPAILAQYLGLTQLTSYASNQSSSSKRHLNSNTFDPGWDLLHLNASIQAKLYSLRILKQCIDYTVPMIPFTEINPAKPFDSNHSSTRHPGDTTVDSTKQIDRHIHTLHTILNSMPDLSALFLSPTETRIHFQTMLQDPKSCELIEEFCKRTSTDLSKFIHPVVANTDLDARNASAAATVLEDTPFQGQKIKKRKQQNMMNAVHAQDVKKKDVRMSEGVQVGGVYGSRNLFDVLKGED